MNNKPKSVWEEMTEGLRLENSPWSNVKNSAWHGANETDVPHANTNSSVDSRKWRDEALDMAMMQS